MRVLVTGRNGFLARNLLLRLYADDRFVVDTWSAGDGISKLRKLMKSNDIIVHLASAIRSEIPNQIIEQNERLVDQIYDELAKSNEEKKLIFSSTTKLDNTEYGLSKKYAEKKFANLGKVSKVTCISVRLPSIFGKFSRPNHNSVVATFCYNAVNGYELVVHNAAPNLNLIYVDDVVEILLDLIENPIDSSIREVAPVYSISLNDLKQKLITYSKLSKSGPLPYLGNEFDKRLFSTLKWFEGVDRPTMYQTHVDERGLFSELIKFEGSGQVSYFTIEKDKQRGGHFHDTKWERFFVLEGRVKFIFDEFMSGKRTYVECAAKEGKLASIDTIPGVIHAIENVGGCQAKLVVWANEHFDLKNPDTYTVERK